MEDLQLFRKAVDALPYGVTLWEADSEHVAGLRLVYANPQASREADIDLGGFVGRPLQELLPGAVLATDGEGLGIKGLETALQRTPHSIPRYHLSVGGERRHFRVHLVPVWERTVAMVYERLPEGAATPGIPEQTQAFFEEIVETLQEPLLVVGDDGRILWGNAVLSDLLGIARDGLDGQALEALPGGGFGAPSLRDAIACLTPDHSALEEVELELQLDGVQHTLLANVRRLLGDGDEPRPILLVLRDVTAEREAASLQRSFVTRLLETRDEDRRNVARELHDEVGQAVATTEARLRTLQGRPEARPLQADLDGILGDLSALARDVARLAAGMHPFVLDELGLEAAIRQMLADFGESHRLQVDFAISGLDEGRLGPEVSLALYRMIQEGLTNVARHAEASSVNIVMRHESGQLRVVVEDDGLGFDPESRDQTTGGLGLVGLRERAALLAGTLELESSPGKGTTFVVSIPC